MRSYIEILKEELIMKNYYDGWTVKGMEEKLKEIEENLDLDLESKFDIIISLVNSHPNNQELGAKVREFIKLQEKQNEFYETI